jgi:hypothetical protein
LTFEKNTLKVNCTAVETWFVDGRTELEVAAKNFVDVFLPQAARFWVALHGCQNWYDSIVGDRVTTLRRPPTTKSFIGEDVKTLFRGGSFTKCIGDIGTKNKKILHSGEAIKNARSCLINAVGVDVVQHANSTPMS